MRKIAFLISIILVLNCFPSLANSFEGGYATDVVEEIDNSFRMGAEVGEISVVDESPADGLFELMADYTDDSYYKEFYGYNKMLELDKKNNTMLAKAYLAMAEGIKEKKTQIDTRGYSLTLDSMRAAYYACIYDLPECFYTTNGFSYTVDFSLIRPKYVEYSWDFKKFEEEAEKILKSSGVRPEMSEYDKALMIHDELARLITYNKESSDAQKITDNKIMNEKLDEIEQKYPYLHSAYGGIVFKDAVCDGYSKAYQYLLKKVGIVSHIAVGIGHAWNLVKIDGEWYYTDLTWNDTDSNNFIMYSHFNGTYDHFVSTGHRFNSPYELPQCDNTKNHYYVKNNMVFESIDNKKLAEQLKTGVTVRGFVTGNQNAVVDWLNNSDEIFDVTKIAGFRCLGASKVYSQKNKEFAVTYRIDQIELSKNMILRIGSVTDKVVRVFYAFYNNKGKLLDAHVEEDVELESKNGIKHIKLDMENAPEKFDYLKVFVWDEEKGFLPLYNFARTDY